MWQSCSSELRASLGCLDAGTTKHFRVVSGVVSGPDRAALTPHMLEGRIDTCEVPFLSLFPSHNPLRSPKPAFAGLVGVQVNVGVVLELRGFSLGLVL